MKNCHNLAVLAVIGMAASAVPALIVQPRTPVDPTTPLVRPQRESKPKSDQDRIVGKVLQIDHERGRVSLATEEGVRVVEPHPQLLRAIYVGDLISVPRSANEFPSASPRSK